MNPNTKPRLKPMVEYLWQNNQIQFFKRPGLAITFKDPKQFIEHSCALMSGELSIDQIAEQLQDLHLNASEQLPKLIAALDREQLLECGQHPPHSIPARYQTNVEFFNAFCHLDTSKSHHQQQLHNKRVVILGLGGVGSNVAIQLLAMGCTQLTVIDHDTVSQDNLNRQIAYTPANVGQNKTHAFISYACQFAPNAKIEYLNTKIRNSDMLLPLLIQADLLVCAIDEPREQVLDWVNTACVQTQTPWVCGGVDYLCLSYFSMVPGKSGCLQCWQDQASQQQPLFQQLIQQDKFVAGKKINVAIMPYIAMLTGLVSNEAVKLLTQYSKPLAVGKLWLFDCTTNNMHIQEQWQRNQDCATCL